jgi:tRNA(His) guanylyltransferase
MGNIKLKDRIESYQTVTDQKLMARVPIIVSVNGRAFSKMTQLLDKPFCPKFSECIVSTMLRLCSDVDGTLFAYQYNDEITLVVRNDQTPDTTPWYNNQLQKICSVTASIATVHFNDCATTVGLNMTGDPTFTSQVFTVPNIAEAINTMVYKQQHNFHTSIQFACFYELLKKSYDKNSIKEMLRDLSVDEKIDLLRQECGVDFNDYSNAFKRGSTCYKVPKVIDGVVKNKWFLNQDLPIFTKDQSFLSNIFKNGADIFRQETL